MTPRAPEHWLLPADHGYRSARSRLSASSWQPAHYPAAISRPRTREQVRSDVRTATEQGLGITVRSGGHSTSGTHLRDAALVLDLGAFRDIAVDTANATARIGPGATALDAARALEETGLFFPLGHAPTVGLGGFLLAGGNGWNTPVWGHGCDRVLAAEVVLADGRLRTIDTATEPDLFALLRGAGPAFPAVVTAFDVSLVREHPQIHRLLVTADGARPADLGQRLDQVIEQLPPHVETTVFWQPARAPGERPRATIAATSFSPDVTDDGLDPLRTAGLPVLSSTETSPGPSLLRMVDPLPRHHGEAVFSDHAWTDTGYAEVLPLLPERAERLLPASCVLLTTCAGRSRTGSVGSLEAVGAVEASGVAEALYRPGGRMSISPYAHWDPAALPAEVAITWARQVIARLQPMTTGRYVGEADLTDVPASPQECFGRDGAARLATLSARFDPDALLYSPFRSRTHHRRGDDRAGSV